MATYFSGSSLTTLLQTVDTPALFPMLQLRHIFDDLHILFHSLTNITASIFSLTFFPVNRLSALTTILRLFPHPTSVIVFNSKTMVASRAFIINSEIIFCYVTFLRLPLLRRFPT